MVKISEFGSPEHVLCLWAKQVITEDHTMRDRSFKGNLDGKLAFYCHSHDHEGLEHGKFALHSHPCQQEGCDEFLAHSHSKKTTQESERRGAFCRKHKKEQYEHLLANGLIQTKEGKVVEAVTSTIPPVVRESKQGSSPPVPPSPAARAWRFCWPPSCFRRSAWCCFGSGPAPAWP